MGGFAGRAGSFAQNVLAAIGLGTLTTGVMIAVVAKHLAKKKLRFQPDLTLPAEGFVLELDLEDIQLVEKQSGGLQALLSKGRPKLELQKAVRALKAAGDDEKVLGLLGLVGSLGSEAGLAQIQELRQAILSFRQKAEGRAASVAYADSFGEGGAGGTSSYYLASAFEHVYMMPSGLLSFTGLAVQQPFARGLLDRLKIRPFVIQREEYKSALSFATGSGFTDAERLATTSLLGDLSAQIVADVAAGRRLTATAVQAAVDGAPHGAAAAARLGLIDGGLYRDQAGRVVGRLGELKRKSLAGVAAAASKSKELQSLLEGIREEGKAQAGEQKTAVQECVPGKVQWRERDEAYEAAAKALLEKPDAEAEHALRRVPLQKYLRWVEAQQAQRQELKQVDSIQQAIRDLQAAIRQEEEEGGKGGQEEARKQKQQGLLGALQVPAVAVATLAGPIVLGRGERSPTSASGHTEIASLAVIKALEAAAANPTIKALVLRIDSPGGSAVASDAIHREIARLRAQGKPVVVSMGNAAASGGYFIACPANKIVAQPATLTGSIGVISGKVVLGEFLKDNGINAETIKTGQNADALSIFDGYTKEQEAHANRLVDEVYATFLQRVADGRGMPLDAVRGVAKGRVWTGQQAYTQGLVDALGGLDDAILLAKKEAQLPLEEDAVLVSDIYPEPKSTVVRLLDFLRGRDSMPAASPGAMLMAFFGLGSGRQLAAGPALQALLLQGCQQLPEGQVLHSLAPQMYSVQAQRVLGDLR